MPTRKRHPLKLTRRVIAEALPHRVSMDAWAAYIQTLRHSDETDILVAAVQATFDPKALSELHLAPLSSDLSEAISDALAGNSTAISIQEYETRGDSQEGWRVHIAARISAVEDHYFEGNGLHLSDWGERGDGACSMSDRKPGVFEAPSECRALAVCLAILDMWRPSPEETAGDAQELNRDPRYAAILDRQMRTRILPVAP